MALEVREENVDDLVVADHLLRDAGVAGAQGLAGPGHRHLDQAADLGEVVEEGFELLVELCAHGSEPRGAVIRTAGSG